MKKIPVLFLCLLLTAFCAFALADVEINSVNFPDEAFRREVEEYDDDGDHRLSDEEISCVYSLELDDAKINSLKGIEFFPELHWLDCSHNNLTRLDVSGNPRLTYLNCSGNGLTALDISGNPALTELKCAENKLASLDVSGSPELYRLSCSYNNLTGLDVSGHAELRELHCYNNKLASLNLSGCRSLTILSCSYNKLAALDLSSFGVLSELDCSDNKLASLDVSGNPKLVRLDCSGNRLTGLDVSGHAKLQDLSCYKNKLAALNVGGCAALSYLRTYDNNLAALDLSGCAALTDLNCGDNKLASLDVSGCRSLSDLRCGGNKLTSLDLSGNPGLTWLYCEKNKLSSLNPGVCPGLTHISCEGNKLKKLDVSGCAALCAKIASEKRVTSSSYDNYYDYIGDSITLDMRVTVTAGAKTKKPTALYQKVRKITGKYVKKSMSEKQKARVLHDWLMDNAKYDYTFTYYGPEGVLLHGTGVCQSYAMAYQMLLNESGVKNILVVGTADNGIRVDGHAWNYVRINGKWSHIDVTWDDGLGDRNIYFMISSERISRDHFWDMKLPGEPNTVKATVDKLKYTLDNRTHTATVTGVADKSAGKLAIPATIRYVGKTYTVTAIKAGALKNCKKLTELRIGSNIESIGKNAVSGCKKLKKLIVETTKLKEDKIGAGCFRNTGAKIKVKCPKKMLKPYQSWFVRIGGMSAKARFTK